jgi:uncharacterized membrane protein YidH (DUF202 family)
MKALDFIKSKYNTLVAKIAPKITAAKAKLTMAFALGSLGITGSALAADGFDPTNAITKMVGYVSAIISGVGVIYGVVAIFNWVSAVKQEDSERASKSIINVFIAGLLICIGPIAAVIITALGGTNTYGLG